MKQFLLAATLAALAGQSLLAQSFAARAYVANSGADTVAVVDDETRKLVATVTTGAGPAGIAVAPDGTAVYVANEGAKTLSIIDPATNQVAQTVTLAGSPRGVTVVPDGSLVFVALHDTNQVEVVETRTRTSIAKINVGRGPRLVVSSLDGAEVYVGCDQETSVSVIDVAKREVVARVETNGAPRSLAVLGNGKLAVTLRWLNGFGLIDTKERKLTGGWVRPEFSTRGATARPFPTDGAFASGLAGYPSGGVTLWISEIAGLLFDVDTAKENYIIGFVPTGAAPAAVALSPDGKTAYVANAGDNTVSVIDMVLHVPVTKIETGTAPRALAVGRVRIAR